MTEQKRDKAIEPRMNNDYFLYFGDFPRAGVMGAVCENQDGTFSIYVNTLYNHRKQMETIRHALRIVAARLREERQA